ncbi:MAG: protein kinase [Myxococcales bacterium]|nr:protein kinase [Myxococcales bacterium]
MKGPGAPERGPADAPPVDETVSAAPRPEPPRGGPTAPAAAPTLPARFEARRELGRGAMGTVIVAFDTVLRREVAVKVLSGPRSRDPAARSQLLVEARAIARLAHPNIVRVLEVDVAAGCIVMELARGETLAARIERAPLGPAELRGVAVQLLDALDAAHRADVLHCDVKPANVIVDDDGTVRLADFGVARLVDEGVRDVAGTPAYMAPECFDGAVDARSDLYSLGATLYRCATGQLAARALDPAARAAALRAQLHDRALAAAIVRALEREPARRPQSAAAFRALLAPPTPRRRRRWLAAAAAVPVLLAAGWFAARRDAPRRASRPPLPGPVALLPLTDRTGDPELAFAPAGVPYLIGLDLTGAADVEIVDYYRLRAAIDGAPTPAAWDAVAQALGARVALDASVEARGAGAHLVLRLRSLAAPSVELRRAEADARATEVPTTARRLARELLGVDPSVATAVRPGEVELALAVAALERHALDEAERTVERALAASPAWPEANYVAALIGWWRGRSPDRVLARARAAGVGPVAPARRAFLDGLVLLVGGHLPEASEHLRGAVALYPDDRDLRYGLFEALWHAGRGAEAVAQYARVVTIAPRFQLGLDHVCAWAFAHGDDAELTRCVARADAVEYPDRTLLRARAAIARRDPRAAVAVLTSHLADPAAAASYHAADLLVLAQAARFDGVAVRAALAALPTTGQRPEDLALAELGVALATGAPPAAVGPLRATARARMIASGASHVFWLRYLAVELALPDDGHQPAILDGFARVRAADVRTAVAAVLAAAQRGDDAYLEAARASPFDEARELATGLGAVRRGELAAAGFAFERAAALSVDGRFLLQARFLEASAWRALGDAARTQAACAEIIHPRVLDWSWTAFVRPCLGWAAADRDRSPAAAAARAALAALR